jgi:succinate dehydrogenase/fumarate reductase cytochrome b subunit
MASQLLEGKAADQPRSAPLRKPRGVWPSNPALALWGTMVGKKVVMAVTGLVLVGFVVGHMLGNLKIFLGAEAIDTYAAFLRTVGEPLIPYSVLLWAVRIVLLTSVALHITAAVQLTRMNWAIPLEFIAGLNHDLIRAAFRRRREPLAVVGAPQYPAHEDV